ncbi:MAG: hypothetical protein PUB87_01275 [Eubacteriaceae bacterium]|nr:hypothetical protein [Eubacteriaceae bacterium]
MFKTFRQIVNDHIKYYRQILFLAKVDKDKSFKGSDLGWIWALFKPSIRIAVYYIAMLIGFRSSGNIPGANCSYFLWFVTGMIPWFYMSDMIVGGATCFKRYRNIILRTDFPNSTIPSIVSLSNLRLHLILMAFLIGMFVIMGNTPSVYWLQIPLYMILMLAFTYVWSMTVGLLSIVNIDIKNALSTLNSMVFWLSGILFNINVIDNEIAQVFFMLNPVTFLVMGYRNSMCFDKWITEDPASLGCFLGVFLVLFVVAMKLYSGLRKRLPDVV